jgi:hypothetical protein
MSTASPSRSNPFPGLRPFHEGEEHLFFGREGQVDAMVAKLALHRFLAVLGSSGSGKSSLVNCGLRPALHRGLMGRAGTSWRIAQFRPGYNPISALAHALGHPGLLFPPSDDADSLPMVEMIEATLRLSKLGLVDIVNQARLNAHTNVLIIADQFEELFRYTGTARNGFHAIAEEATAFVNLLLEAASAASERIYVVVTMRSDFLGDCAQFPGLPEAINQGQYLVPRLTREERRAAIAGPVGVAGGTISPVLLTRLVNDVGDNPDQLSILQHALNRTWAHWANEGKRGGSLAVQDYEYVGAMTRALDKHAEKAFAELSLGQQGICEKVFKTLTDMGTDARGIRRPTHFGILCAIADAEAAAVSTVIDAFRKRSRSFLMPPIDETLSPETVIDISHESLMRLWKRLEIWAHEEAESAHLYRRLSDDARRYGLGRARLWGDPDLQFALDWRERMKPTPAWAELYGGEFTQSMEFLEASKAQREHEIARAQEEEQRELERTKQLAAAQASRARLLRIGLWIAVLVAVLGCTLGFYAFSARNNANRLLISARETQANNITGFLASHETPPSPTDFPVLWGLFSARPEVVSEVLDVVFTEMDPMRKATVRGYAFRRSIIGFDERNTALVKQKLSEYCGKEQMSNPDFVRRPKHDHNIHHGLERTGACIAVARGLYPADPAWVIDAEEALHQHWAAWKTDEGAVNGTPFRDWVAGQLHSLIHSLDANGAAAVARNWQQYIRDSQPPPDRLWHQHIRNGWTRAVENMNDTGQSELAAALMEKLDESQGDLTWHPLVMLTAVANRDTAVKTWEALLNSPQRRHDARWLREVVKVAPRLGSDGAAKIQRKLINVDHSKLQLDALGAWLFAVRVLARQTSPEQSIALATDVLARPHNSAEAWRAMATLLESLTTRDSTPGLYTLIQRMHGTLNRLEKRAKDEAVQAELARLAESAHSALNADLRNVRNGASRSRSVSPRLESASPAIQWPTNRIRAEIVRWVDERVEYDIKFGTHYVEDGTKVLLNEGRRKVFLDLLRAVRKAGFSGAWESSFDEHLKRACANVLEQHPQRFSEDQVTSFENLVLSYKNKNGAIGYLLEPPAQNEDDASRIHKFQAIAEYMTTEIRALLYENRAFADFLDVLLAIDVPNSVRADFLRNQLLKIHKSHRSVALCYRLEPAEENSSTAYRMLDKWGIGGGLDQVIVGEILQWPDCPPNGVFPVVRKLAELKGQNKRDLGDRLGLVVMEQFADWARKHGYKFTKLR